VNADIVEYTLAPDSRAVGRRLSQMALPEDTVIAMVTRGEDVIPPRGSTKLLANDHLFAVLRPGSRTFVDRAFTQASDTEEESLPSLEIRLKGNTRVEDVRNSYGIDLAIAENDTLETVVRRHLEEEPKVDATIVLNGNKLRVCEIL